MASSNVCELKSQVGIIKISNRFLEAQVRNLVEIKRILHSLNVLLWHFHNGAILRLFSHVLRRTSIQSSALSHFEVKVAIKVAACGLSTLLSQRRDVVVLLYLQSLNLIQDREVSATLWLSGLLLLREISLLLLPLEMLLHDGASPVFDAVFHSVELLIDDVVLEGRFLQGALLAIVLDHCAGDLPLLVGVVNSEYLFR